MNLKEVAKCGRVRDHCASPSLPFFPSLFSSTVFFFFSHFTRLGDDKDKALFSAFLPLLLVPVQFIRPSYAMASPTTSDEKEVLALSPRF